MVINTVTLLSFRDIIIAFCTKEVIIWRAFCENYEAELKSDAVFIGATECEKLWEQLDNRVIEHNIRIMAGYYTNVRLSRMAALLGIDEKTLEKFLSDLVVNKTIEAKIDRLMGILYFTKTKDATEIVNDCSHNMNNLLSLIKKTTHLINKERMINHVG